MHRISVLFLLLGISGMGLGQLDPIKQEQVDSLIENLMKENMIPGLGLSIVQNGEVAVAKGYGLKDIALGASADENTLFSIGSITKSFVAALAVKTFHEKFPDLGEMALDTPVNRLLEQLNLGNSNLTLSDRYRTNYITFRDMLSHRNCLSSADTSLIFDTVKDKDEVYYRFRYMPEICDFRAGYFYNNAMYGMAAELLALMNGVTVQNLIVGLMREIGMTTATVIDPDGSYEGLADMSMTYTIKDGETIEFNPLLLRRVAPVVGAGGILASASDMASYMNFHLNGGKVGDVQIIPEDVMQRLYVVSVSLNTVQGKMSSESDSVTGSIGYALGLDIALYDGWTMVSHGGYWPPYSSQMHLFQNNIGIFISTNGPGTIGSDGAGQRDAILAIFDILREKTRMNRIPTPLPIFNEFLPSFGMGSRKEIPNFLQKRNARQIKAEELLGIYGDPVNGDMTLTWDPEDPTNSTLQMNYGEWGIGSLEPIDGSDTLFNINFKTDLPHHFYTYQSILPYPVIEADVSFLDAFVIYVDSIPNAVLIKNATLETFPEIPWLPDSCGPSN